MVAKNYYHDKLVDEKVKGTNIAGKEDISVSAGSDINVKEAAPLPVRKVRPALLQVATSILPMRMNTTKSSNESHEKSKGFLSSKTTDIYDYSNISGVVSSNVSAGA